jgi:hypothetical protein
MAVDGRLTGGIACWLLAGCLSVVRTSPSALLSLSVSLASPSSSPRTCTSVIFTLSFCSAMMNEEEVGRARLRIAGDERLDETRRDETRREGQRRTSGEHKLTRALQTARCGCAGLRLCLGRVCVSRRPGAVKNPRLAQQAPPMTTRPGQSEPQPPPRGASESAGHGHTILLSLVPHAFAVLLAGCWVDVAELESTAAWRGGEAKRARGRSKTESQRRVNPTSHLPE